jgi:hypothetical protein
MPAIFYDLETSDRYPIGQILNYSFIEVGNDFSHTAELSGAVRLSRLQLPSPDSILANRVDVLALQRTAAQSEKEALLSISRFIEERIRLSKGRVALIGYNSSRFDLGFLRTALIRNGLNPYFGGKLAYRDVLQSAWKLSVTKADFPRPIRQVENIPGGKMSLSLEALGQALGLLSGAQTHEARADVLLTIAMAKTFRDRWGLDVRDFESYEGTSRHQRPPKGDVFLSVRPNYEPAGDTSPIRSPVTLLDFDHRSALWIDLERFERSEGRAAISWYSLGKSWLFLEPAPADNRHADLARRALKEFSGITLANYFSENRCDIELDIYRIDFNGIELLRTAIWDRNAEALKDSAHPGLLTLYRRHGLANYTWGGDKDARVKEYLAAYALHRYGGKLIVEGRQGSEAEVRHQTFSQLLARIRELRSAPAARQGDRELLDSLERYYFESDLYRAAGKALEEASPA